MMGSPYYYDVHFDPVDVIFNDCMWSGTCCIQLVQQQQQPAIPFQPTQSQHQLTLHGQHQLDNFDKLIQNQEEQTQHPSEVKQEVVEQQIKRPSQKSHFVPHIRSHRVRLMHPPKVPSKLHHRSQQHSRQHQQTQQPRQQQEAYQQLAQGNHQQHSNSYSNSHNRGENTHLRIQVTDSKKLRHREVEKNRHRQLQAMVKTLSDRIPGKVDKETQVHTMKRAARYCQYLHDVLNHGQTMSAEELECLYLRSCESVDLMMSQQSLGT